jgi:hypothetical protein
MSWDITVHRFPKSIDSIEQLPDDFIPPAISSRAKIAKTIKENFPDAVISDLSW